MRLLPLFQDLPQLTVARDHLSAETQTKIHHEAFDFLKYTFHIGSYTVHLPLLLSFLLRFWWGREHYSLFQRWVGHSKIEIAVCSRHLHCYITQWLNVWPTLNVQTELCSIWLKKILAWNLMRWEGIIYFCDHFIGLVGCRCLQGTFNKATFSHVTGEASGLLLGLTSSWSFCNLTWLKTRLPSLPHTALSSSLFREKSWAPVRIPKQSVALQKSDKQSVPTCSMNSHMWLIGRHRH